MYLHGKPDVSLLKKLLLSNVDALIKVSPSIIIGIGILKIPNSCASDGIIPLLLSVIIAVVFKDSSVHNKK